MINTMKYMVTRLGHALRLDDEGVALIEYALFLPVATMFSLGVIEFGNYFVRNEVANNAVSTVTQSILNNPTYYSSLSSTQLTDVEKSYGSGLIDFTKTGNNLCVQAFRTPAQAAAAGACTSTSLTAQNPNPGNAFPYYIVVQADLPRGNTVTPLGNLVPNVKQIQVTQSSGVQVIGNNVPPPCSNPGFFLQYDPSQVPAWQCVGYAQVAGADCSQPWQNMHYDSTSGWSCAPTSYVIAGGIENISMNSNAFWSGSGTDNIAMEYTAQLWTKRGGERTNNWQGAIGTSPQTWTQKSNLPYSTYCVPISFTIPAGLSAGQIIPQGNLAYMGANTDSNWHDWVVSFVHTDTGPAPPTTSAYNGSAVLCMSSQAELAAFNPHPPTTESISWTVTFVPSSR